jgi:hypothetical protein
VAVAGSGGAGRIDDRGLGMEKGGAKQTSELSRLVGLPTELHPLLPKITRHFSLNPKFVTSSSVFVSVYLNFHLPESTTTPLPLPLPLPEDI